MAQSILGTLLLNIVAQSNTSGLDQTDRALKRTGNTMKSMSKDMGIMGKLSQKFMGYFSLGNITNVLGRYLQLEKDVGAMKSRFFAITQDEKAAGEEFEWVRKLATDTALDVKSTADSYSIFYSAVQKSIGTGGAREVYEDWAKVGRVLHFSDYQMERVTYALREMASKGAIYSQDLRMQIGTHVPNAMGLAQKAAEEMGVTGTDWFEKLQSKVKGSTKLTGEFVRRFSEQARKMYGSEAALKKAMQQPDALAKEISNIGYNFMLDFSKAGGSYMVIKILKGISDILTKIDYNALTTKLGIMAKTFGDIFNYLTKHIGIIVFLLKIMAFGYFFKQAGKVFGFLKNVWTVLSILTSRGNKAILGMALKGILGTSRGVGLAAVLDGVIGAVIKGFLPKLLGFLGGPWGIVLTLLATFLPMAIGFLKKKGEKEITSLQDFKDRLGGKSPEQVANIAKKLQTMGVTDQADLNRKLTWFKGGGDLLGQVEYKDNKHVTINIDGSNISPEELIDVIDRKIKNVDIKSDKIGKFFQKPFNPPKEDWSTTAGTFGG